MHLASDEHTACFPTIHIVSDSIGETAQVVARAAAAQFGVTEPHLDILSKVTSFDEVRSFLADRASYAAQVLGQQRICLFYTLVDAAIRGELEAYLDEHPDIVAVDVMTRAVSALSLLSGMQPQNTPGALRELDHAYFKRIAAIEFTIAHDDGRAPEDLTHADIVLLGVSRSSKTPLSIYLSQQGYRVANVPLDPSTEPPAQIFEVDRTRLFGLMISPEVLIGIRRKRMAKAAGKYELLAKNYADPEYVYRDLEAARSLMRRLGCIVVHTEQRAVEETAQEILRYYERSHPASSAFIE